MKKLQRQGPSPSVSIDTLSMRAAEALRQERFKEAIELFKLMIRQDPRRDWKVSLADAYRGRARDLAAKRMFKEAAMVLENTLAPDGTVRDPRMYVTCLIRDGQQPKAAAYLLRTVSGFAALPAAERDALEELTAALLVAVPQLPDLPRDASSEVRRWHELANASRRALAAWIDGLPADEINQRLNAISLRSAFRPVRLLLRSLIGTPRDHERTRTALDTIADGSPFAPFRQAVEAAMLGESGLDADGWNRLTPAQQTFVAESRGLPATSAQFLTRSVEAARGGPGMLFGFLLRQPDLPQTEVRSACLNLLPQIPDRMAQFEKTFGPLSAAERHRISALAAEARGDWDAVERGWQLTAQAIADAGTGRHGKLSQGTIYRHLAELAKQHPEIEGFDYREDPVINYLERSRAADPEHIPTVLDLIEQYRKDAQPKEWHRLVDEAVQQFPEDSQVLQAATESAMERKAFKKAAGFARKLLTINPINNVVRRQMIELQVAHARKQMRSKRPDLAAKELAAAAEWERSDTPSPLLRIARGLVELRTGDRDRAELWLREGVNLAGGGVAGWFRAQLEAELMKSTGGDAGWLRSELVKARESIPPTREAVMAIVTALGQPEAAENKRAVAALLLGARTWLLQAATLEWSAAEFQAVAEVFARFESFELLQEYARALRQRDPANPASRFYEILARTRGDADRLSASETTTLLELASAAAQRQDFHAAMRIERFLGGPEPKRVSRRRAAAEPDPLDEIDLLEAFITMMDTMPKGSADNLRGLVGELGREKTIDHMVEQLRFSPLGPNVPEPVLRELAQAMVARALEGNRSRSSGNAHRSRF